jgi:hypothetical protein
MAAPATYHPDPATIITDGTRCVGRRMIAPDRRWSPMIYTTGQCKKAPVAGSDLCETCRRREAKGTYADDWNGRITGPVPDDSHTIGSLWFTTTAPTWLGDAGAKPMTARQAAALPKAPLVPEAALQNWVRGARDLDIHALAAAGQIRGAQLDALYTQMGGTLKSFPSKSKADKCVILIAMRDAPPSPPPSPPPPAPVAAAVAAVPPAPPAPTLAALAARIAELEAANAAQAARIAELEADNAKLVALRTALTVALTA